MIVVADPTDLDVIARRIHAEWQSFKGRQLDAWHGYLTVGSLLLEARTKLPANRDYGEWLKEQDFGFSRQWANRLVRAAENRPAIEQALESALSDGKLPPGVDPMLAMIAPPTQHNDGEVKVDRPEPVYLPDHHRSAVIEVIVTYPIGTTKRELGSGHGSGAERGEWHGEFVMGADIPTSLMEVRPFVLEAAERLLKEIQARPFRTMLR